MRQFSVKNPFYLGGAIQATGVIIELDDEIIEVLSPKNVLGKEIIQAPVIPPLDVPLSVEAFGALSAAEQKEELQRLRVEGDAGNKEERLSLYVAYLAGEANAQTKTGSAAAIGAHNTDEDTVTT